MQQTYNFLTIEQQTQQRWRDRKSFKAEPDTSKEKFYCLSMLPYPSGSLHMGHVRNYTLGDVITRYQKMLGKNVLQPMGWDAFGLPAENAAIKHKKAPAEWTYSNIQHMKDQLQSLGLGYDWDREIATCQDSYYRWEQWFFIQLYKKGLVYRKNSVVNWDPVDQTVLANEQVVDGRGWRSGALIEKKEIPQWFVKITDYADELLADLDKLSGWPEAVKIMQTNWIGKSKGINIRFDIVDERSSIEVFTTRPDTLMGATFLSIAAEHPLALKAAETNAEIAAFIAECKTTSTMEADLATAEKKGMATPFYAIHPITAEKMAIWIANFVLMGYGTGAVMSVPAHDQRDWEFAKVYDIPLKQVITTDNAKIDLNVSSFEAYGRLINSGKFDGLDFDDAYEAIKKTLIDNGHGYEKINFRIHDWGVSRQRYWGCPIPMIHCHHCGIVAESEENLPVKLPENVTLEGVGSPLTTMSEFRDTSCPKCGREAERETDTFDTFMESSWYYARYTCPETDAMLDDEANYWLPVDQYIGGIEHAIMHLLYARFYHKLLRDAGLVKSDEPFTNLLTQGMVLKDGAKMSKSKGNTVDPQLLIEKYGADTVRLFSMFAAPPEQSLEWSDTGVEGAHRFLKKLWNFGYDNRNSLTDIKDADYSSLSAADKRIRFEIHTVLKQARFDFDKLQFNTVVSGGMKILNALQTAESALLKTEGLGILLRLLSPFAPHITQHMWQVLGFGDDVLDARFPEVDNKALIQDEFTLIVQVNGKLRARLCVSSEMDEEAIKTQVLNDKAVVKFVPTPPKKVIYVPKKLLNIVV
ncbi:MAG: leucine--tRNA ligase [Francisellaceae bacterium]